MLYIYSGTRRRRLIGLNAGRLVGLFRAQVSFDLKRPTNAIKRRKETY